MSLNIYLDDCAYSRILRRLLEEAGYVVEIPAEVDPDLTGAKDEDHFAYTKASQQILLTYNPDDFEELHDQDSDHSGIFAVYQDNDKMRDMTYHEIVKAIQNLEETGADIAGNFWNLNHYQW